MIAFKAIVKEIEDINTSVGLHLDVSTRWNSTFFRLESVLPYQQAFQHLGFNDTNDKYCPSTKEWKSGQKMCEFMHPFYVITNLISRSSYPTSNLHSK